jgi:DNA-binding response OmpR family regulator
LDFTLWCSAQHALQIANPLKSTRVAEQTKKVVVIGEDDEPIAALLRDAISDEPGYQAVVVSDGALVLETVRQVHADLLILDIMMPGLSGLEVYDRVREDSNIRDMPVLFVSANTPMFDSEFRKRNLTSVLTKPFDLNDLLQHVRELCPA